MAQATPKLCDVQALVRPGWDRPPWLWAIIAAVVVAFIAAVVFLWTRDSSVTRWHVPYQVVRGGVGYPLHNKRHCFSFSEIAPIRRVGTASGLALFALPVNDPEVFYVQPKGYRCYMEYLSLSHVG